MPKKKEVKPALSHVAPDGRVRMVDVSAKAATQRTASASAQVTMPAAVVRALRGGAGRKGDSLEIARIAGITAAKRTADLIPLCHPLPLTHIEIEARYARGAVKLLSCVSTTAPTGARWKRSPSTTWPRRWATP